LDFNGNKVLGRHYLLGIDKWCLVNEIEESEILKIPENIEKKRGGIVQIPVFLISIFLIIFFYIKINKKIYLKFKPWVGLSRISSKKYGNKKIFFASFLISLLIILLFYVIFLGLDKIINNISIKNIF